MTLWISIGRKQSSIYRKITRKPGSILHTDAGNALSSLSSSVASWFLQICGLCLFYGLPNPLQLLASPPSKYKRKIKALDYWKKRLRLEASNLRSLTYFKQMFMSLVKTHPVWTSCGSNALEVHKATVTVRMMAGRYQTDMLQRHWTSNKSGYCLLPTFTGNNIPGSLEHLLLYCPDVKRRSLLQLARSISAELTALHDILDNFLSEFSSEVDSMQLLLDCTVMPSVIRCTQLFGHLLRDRLLYFGRTWCYNIHRERMNLMGLLQYR